MFRVIPTCLTLVIGLAIGWQFGATTNSVSKSAFSESRGGGFEFINPLLECNVFEEGAGFTELRPFKNKVSKIVDSFIKSGRATHVSVYFRDLNNGPWFGINERETFAAGSLLKVPLMITAFRQEELTPGFLNGTLQYKEQLELPKQYFQQILPKESVEVGSTYTVENLVRRAIDYSDNEATILLYENMDKKLFAKTHADLGVIFPSDETPEDYISVKNYASFFRILFNASYLTREHSEKALRILNEIDFSDGLPAGIPRSVKVAHKFGERGEGTKKQLHDCGIIYYPNHPYLLCVMNRGPRLETLAKNIAEISALVYKEVAEQIR